MQVIACLLFLALPVLASADKRLNLHTIPAQPFGKQVNTEYDENATPETQEASEFESNGMTLGITVGTQPQELQRFGTQKLIVSEAPLKKFGSQAEVPSRVPPEEPFVDGLQRWGAQDSGSSELPVEPSEYKLQSWGAQVSEASEIPLEKNVPKRVEPITMSEAMAPHLTQEERGQSSIVVSEESLDRFGKGDSAVGLDLSHPEQEPITMTEAMVPHVRQDGAVQSSVVLSDTRLHPIVVSQVPFSHFGKGDVADDFDASSWHNAWQTAPARRLRAVQQQLAAEPAEVEVMPSFEAVVQVWRYVAFVMCIAMIACHVCGVRKVEDKPFLNA